MQYPWELNVTTCRYNKELFIAPKTVILFLKSSVTVEFQMVETEVRNIITININIQNLTGGTGSDMFGLEWNAQLNGQIRGGNGTDTLDY